eukprot:511775-Pleurochrysis_carterae.AAC.3
MSRGTPSMSRRISLQLDAEVCNCHARRLESFELGSPSLRVRHFASSRCVSFVSAGGVRSVACAGNGSCG